MRTTDWDRVHDAGRRRNATSAGRDGTAPDTPGGAPGPDAGEPLAPSGAQALVAYGRGRLWDARRRLRAEVSAWRPARHPHASDQAARFETLYANERDPFHYASDGYEQRKYTLCLAMLPVGDFARAYEPGCSIGELTVGLAPRCASLLAADVSAGALARAAQRAKGYDHVTFERHLLPRDHPAGPFDLVVMGELGYYLEPAALKELVGRMAASLAPGGHLLAVHGRGASPDIYCPGDVVHRMLLLRTGLRHVAGYREEAFRIDLLRRA